MKKKPLFLLLSACIGLSSFTTPLFAKPLHHPNATFNSESPMKSESRKSNHKKCPHAYKKLIAAIESLKKDGLITEEEVMKIYKSFSRLPKEILENAEDKDLAIAEALYKDQLLTESQYNKILEILKK